MFLFAIFLGIISYANFFLGIAGLLYAQVVIICMLIIAGVFIYLERNKLSLHGAYLKVPKPSMLLIILLISLLLQVLINFMGALVPELAFDALWYHLTLPKLYLLNHSVYHIPGGLLYYSDMPKLGEMLYVGALAFGNEITAKIMHFLFGLLSTIALYLLCRKFFSQLVSVIAVVIFYSNMVVAWESTTAYVDLIRTFFEILALWSFINWKQTVKRKWLFLSALMVGLAITTKFLAFGSLVIFSLLILLPLTTKNLKKKISHIAAYALIAIAVPLPWLIFAYTHTGNPFYPFFSSIYQIAPEPLSFTEFFIDTWNVFLKASDPISPLYIIFLPLIIMIFPKMRKEIKLVTFYSALAIIIWYFTPRTGGGRFILPYLPAFSVLCAAVIDMFIKQKSKLLLTRYLLGLVLFTAVLTAGYRFLAQTKYTPVLIGSQTKHDFLKDNLNFTYGDFYDTDSFFAKTIKPSDKVLLYGFHNLYYVDFPFIDSSWIQKGERFTYIAVQKSDLPETYRDWQLIYVNDKTMVKLYKNKYKSETIF